LYKGFIGKKIAIKLLDLSLLFPKIKIVNICSSNPDKPEPKLNAKTKTETNKIEFGNQFDWLIADRNSQK